MRLYFGIDVGGTKLSAALVTGKGRILSRAKVSTPRSQGSRAVLEAVEGLVRRVAAEGKVRVKDAEAAGAGLPG
ncbi:MAG: ROK family protein, partial [Elusimicrobiota bacterium]